MQKPASLSSKALLHSGLDNILCSSKTKNYCNSCMLKILFQKLYKCNQRHT